jgi:hypothetical protein
MLGKCKDGKCSWTVSMGVTFGGGGGYLTVLGGGGGYLTTCMHNQTISSPREQTRHKIEECENIAATKNPPPHET